MKTFRHINANSPRQAAGLLKSHNGRARAIAGGTDLLGALKDKITPDYPEVIINLKSIAGLDHIRQDGRTLKIGALARLADVAASPEVKTRFPMLAEAAHAVASPQVRNMATIGGNLCQDVRCWYYRYPHSIGGRINCYLKGGKICYALNGENQYHSIFGGCRTLPPPCTQACPGSIEMGPYLDLVRRGRVNEAAFTLIMNNPLPAITGRVCPHWCEQDCNRGSFDQPVSIRGVERYLGDYILEHASELIRPPQAASGKKVAVAGAGPAGLSAACYLRMAGHAVTVFDKMPEPGGFLSYAIPAYRLPKEVVKKTIEISMMAGIEFKLNTELGKDITLDTLRKDFDAVFLATGAWKPRSIGLENEDLTTPGLEFLARDASGLARAPGDKVLVIGGGNVAVDVAITARRLGARGVTLACLECREEMPAFPSEIQQAVEEGIRLMPSWGPARVLTSNGRVTGMELVCCASVFDGEGRFAPSFDQSKTTTVEADAIIMAVGQAADLSFLGAAPAPGGIKVERGLIAADPVTQETGLAGVFVGGEATSGPASVIQSIAAGRRAAAAINARLAPVPSASDGSPVAQNRVAQASLPVSVEGASSAAAQRVGQAFQPVPVPFLRFDPSCLKNSDRVPQPILPVARRGIDTEDLAGYDRSGAGADANRCFNCGCVASSPSDMAVALMALGGKLKLTGPSGARTVPVEEVFGSFRKVLQPEELVTEIQVPLPPPGARQVFNKFRIRKSIDFPIVSVASVLTMKNGACKDASIVLGAVAPLPIRATSAEQAIKGKPLTGETAAAAAEAALKDVLPLVKNDYKVQIARTLVKRVLMGDSSQ